MMIFIMVKMVRVQAQMVILFPRMKRFASFLTRVDGAAASDVWMKLDYDDGRAYYEGEIYYNNTEYEFEMNAATGGDS